MGTRIVVLANKIRRSVGKDIARRRLVATSARAIDRILGHAASPVPKVRISTDPAISYAHDVVIRRAGKGFDVLLSDHNPGLTRENGPERLPAYLYWLMHSGSDVDAISATLSDGDRASAATFSPSTFDPRVTLLPDPIFFLTGGYAAERALSLHDGLPWEDRTAELVWRGGMNSQQSFNPDVAERWPEHAAQRLLACLFLRGVPGTDVKLIGTRQPETARTVYEQIGVSGRTIEPKAWLGWKYALDVDGYSNAWSNLFTRLLFGCCVLKVESRFGFRQWYYDRLQPWEHYVPVKADLSDATEQLDWVRSHDAEAREIAQRGRLLVLGLTLSAVTDEAAALICTNWQARPV